MSRPIRVLMITNEWPIQGLGTAHFIKRQADFLRAAGVDVDVFVFKGEKKVQNYARAWAAVRPRLRAKRYDLVHAQWGQSALLAFPKVLPLVVTLRGCDLLGDVSDVTGRHNHAGTFLRFVTRMVARCADAVIIVSAHMKAALPRAVPATVIPSGLDLELFRYIPRDEARRHLGLALGTRLVLFAANPAEARKRFSLAQQAVALLNRALPAELVVAWSVPHADMPFYMNAADVMVFTSMQEGSPNVVKEALACDLPVVSVPVGDVPERLRGVEGCEVSWDERPEALAAALERVLRRGSRVAARDAVKCLDEHNIAAQVISVYQAVLSRRGLPVTWRRKPTALEESNSR